MSHHTKDKGDLGVLKAQADLASQGYMVLLPLTEHAAFDLVSYKDRTFQRIQVKFRSCNRRGCLEVRFRSIWNDRNGTHKRRLDKSEVDLICVYCPDTDACYYFDPSHFNESISLRLRSTKNNQLALVKSAEHYRRVPCIGRSQG